MPTGGRPEADGIGGEAIRTGGRRNNRSPDDVEVSKGASYNWIAAIATFRG